MKLACNKTEIIVFDDFLKIRSILYKAHIVTISRGNQTGHDPENSTTFHMVGGHWASLQMPLEDVLHAINMGMRTLED